MSVDVSVVIPVYNEEDSVRPLRDAVVAALEPTGLSFEILYVDDGSRDGTLSRLEALSREDPRVVALKFRRNAGQTAAMTAGIDYARGRRIVTMDGDLQNDPADIPMMLARIDEGYDLVVGWRINRQDKFLTRKLPSMIANRLIGRITGLPIRDNGCSLKVYRADMIKRVPLYSEMHRFIPAMTIPLGARVAEVGVRHHARRFGASKYGLSRVYKVALDLMVIRTLLAFSRRPLASFSALAAFFALVAVATTWAGRPALGDGAGYSVVFAAVTGLLAALALFLAALGFVVAVVHQAPDFAPPRRGATSPSAPGVADVR